MRHTLFAIPLLCLCAACVPPRVGPGSVLLSNNQFGPTEVEAVLTTNPICAERGPGVVARQRFVIPHDATRFVEAPSGTNVCWRRAVTGADHSEHWSNWNLTYTDPGRSIDSSL
ncbi:MAG: hypothetical protein ACREE4_17790 [Stellaceae bacterium]